MNSCVFCLEGADSRELLYNVKCRCNFYFHMDCYELYNKKTVCPLCRSEVGHLFSPIDTYIEYAQPAPSAPYEPPAITVHIPYQHQIIHAQQFEVRDMPQRTRRRRCWCTICCVFIASAICVGILYAIH